MASLLISGSAFAANNGVRITDSHETVTYAFESKPTVTFENGMLMVDSDEGSVEFPMTVGVTFDFVEIPEPGAVEAVRGEGIQVCLTLTEVEISNLLDGTQVNVYDTVGKLVASSEADSLGVCRISIRSLPKGALIFNTGSRAHKLIIR